MLQARNTQQTMPSETFSQRSTPEKDRAIALQVQQCFEIQDTYGKTPEQLKTLMRVMMEDLKPFSLERIEAAFRQWRQENEKIPTVAGILKLIAPETYKRPEYNQDQHEEKCDYQRLTPEEKKNLDAYTAKAKRMLESGEVPINNRLAPWHGINWDQMDYNCKQALKNHIVDLAKDKGKERAQGYIQYLGEFHKVPANFFAFEELNK